MEINISDYFTFRNVVLVIFCLPISIMIVSLPFLAVLSKTVKQIIVGLGYFGGLASSVISVELIYRTIASIIDYKYQKPQIVFDNKSGITNRYETFDSAPLFYLIVFVIITILTWFVADIYSTKIKFGRLPKPYSDKNPLNLSE